MVRTCWSQLNKQCIVRIVGFSAKQLLIYWNDMGIQFESNGEHEQSIIYNRAWIDVNETMSNKLRKHIRIETCHEIDCAFCI